MSVTSPGPYQVSGRLLDANGAVVTAAGSRATLAAGSQAMDLRFDGPEVFQSQRSGPYTLVDVVLSHDVEAGDLEAEVARMGPTGPYDFRQFEHFKVEIDLSGFSDQAADDNGDGTIDFVDVYGRARVDDAGSYAINARLTSNGTEVAEFQTVATLTAGSNGFTLRFPWQSLQQAGLDGPYTVEDLSIYPVADSDTLGYLTRAWVTQPYRLTSRPADTSCRTSDYRIAPAASTGGEPGDSLAVLVSEPFVTNGPYDPCVTASAGGSQLDTGTFTVSGAVPVQGRVSADMRQSGTVSLPGRAEASFRLVEELRVTVTSPARFDLSVTGAVADVLAECARGSSSLSGSSMVGSVTVNGVRYAPADQPMQVPIPTVGTLHLNYEQRSDTDAQGGNDTIVRRAVFLDSVNSAIPDIVVGEAKASARGC